MTTRSKEMIVEETEEEAEKDAVVRFQGDSDNEPTSSCPQTRQTSFIYMLIADYI
jgi:hypothetical protein